jgi:Spy/CpxP family protein refolding chaperone
MKKSMTFMVTLSFLALSAASSFAQPLQKMPRAKGTFAGAPNRILGVLKANQEELEITDQQMEQIQNLLYSYREKSIEMRNEISLNRLELQKMLQDRDNWDYEKIEAVLSESSAYRHEMFIQGLKLREEMDNVLTPEQRESLKAKARNILRLRTRDLRDRVQQRAPVLRNRIRR